MPVFVMFAYATQSIHQETGVGNYFNSIEEPDQEQMRGMRMI